MTVTLDNAVAVDLIKFKLDSVQRAILDVLKSREEIEIDQFIEKVEFGSLKTENMDLNFIKQLIKDKKLLEKELIKIEAEKQFNTMDEYSIEIDELLSKAINDFEDIIENSVKTDKELIISRIETFIQEMKEESKINFPIIIPLPSIEISPEETIDLIWRVKENDNLLKFFGIEFSTDDELAFFGMIEGDIDIEGRIPMNELYNKAFLILSKYFN